MERFNDYVAQYTIELGQDQEENAVAKIENARRIRSEVNRQSQRIYGVPFNQLDGELFLALMEDVWHSESLGDESVSSCEAETASVTELSSCSCSTFSYVTSPGGFAAWYNSSGRRRLANWPYCNDCDLEVLFPPNKSVLKYVTPAGLTYYTYTGGHLIYNKSSSNTHVLIGYDAVMTIFLGQEWAAQVAYRLD